MEKQNNEFLGLLCNLYLVALLFALPLYTGQGYWQLGETKYTLFRSVTLLCLGFWLAAGMPARLSAAASVLNRFLRRRKDTAGRRGIGARFDKVDLAVAAYAVCAVVSAACSTYGQLAWLGYEGWYMGAVSQLLFAGIYFFVSRQYNGAPWPLYLGEAALGLATVLGLLHRVGIDPLGLLKGWNSGDWEYSHMLSTLGNINWLCGYYSVALAFLTVHFLLEKRRRFRIVLYVTEVSAFVLLGIQGSEGGILILVVCAVTSFWLGRHNREIIKKVVLVLAGFFAAMPLMWLTMCMRGDKAAIVGDGNVFAHTEWYVWITGAAVCLIFYFCFRTGGGRKGACINPSVRGEESVPADRTGRNRKKAKTAAAVIFAGVAAGVMLAGYLHRHPFNDSFGSGRGFLWRISVESFTRAGLKDKLLGAGPDCYGEDVFNRLGTGTEVWKDEHWEGAVFTNAHNEVLSQLCNVGILGTLSYLAVFIAGFCAWGGGRPVHCRRQEDCGDGGAGGGIAGRESAGIGESVSGRESGGTGECVSGRESAGIGESVSERESGGIGECVPGSDGGIGGKNEMYYRWLGGLALAMYGMHALVSFQQVLSTPLLFLVLGICRSGRRRMQMEEEVQRAETADAAEAAGTADMKDREKE